MKIPNFASLYQSGTLYSRNDCQSARNGPSWTTVLTRFKIAARSESYLLLALCQTRSMVSGGSDAVGDWESELARISDEKGQTSNRTRAAHANFRPFAPIASPFRTVA